MSTSHAPDWKFVPASERIECMPPDLEGLDSKQLKALHTFRKDLIAAAHSLYTSIPQPRADAMLRKLFQAVVDDLESGKPKPKA